MIEITGNRGEKVLRVAQVVGKMAGGGVEHFIMNYYTHIDHNKVQFDFIVNESSTRVPELCINRLGGRVFYVPGYKNPFAYVKAVRRILEAGKYGIVHSHVNALSLLPLYAALQAGTPVRIAHAHSTSGGVEVETVKNITKYALKKAIRDLPTVRLACSEDAGEWLHGKAPFDVVHNAVDLGRFTYSEHSRTILRKELSIPEECFVIGHVGRLCPQKNQQFAIRMLAHVVNYVPNALLLLVGEGPDKVKLEKLASSYGVSDRVRFLGYLSDVGSVYSAFDVFVLPSAYEGLGMVAIEAQVSGLPCIVSDNVPREVKMTDEVYFASLKSVVNGWANQVVKISKTPGSRQNVDTKAFSDYDIETKAVELTNWYLGLENGSIAVG